MSNKDQRELLERANAELKANEGLGFRFELSLLELISILGALQLALRHPKYIGPSSIIVKGFIEKANSQLDGTPAIQAAIKSEDDPYPGWKPRKRTR